METAIVSSTAPVDNVDGQSNTLHSFAPYDENGDEMFISDSVVRWLEIFFYGVISAAISAFGIIANAINIVIFVKQGLNDSVNISLLGLSVSDLGSALTEIWMCICMTPLFRNLDIPFDSVQVQHLTAGLPKDCFSRITCWITAYITFERCLCIVFPLKIKDIITAKRTTLIITSIFLFTIAATLPAFLTIRIGSTFIAARNKTLLGLVYLENGLYLESISYSISAFTTLSSFPMVIIFTLVLVRNLLTISQWRKTASGISASAAEETFSTLRDMRVVKMVSFIASIHIVCFLPTCINIILILLLSPEYSVAGQYEHIFALSWAVIFVFAAVNSSVNIFIYHTVSSKYRVVFNKLFGIDRQKERNTS